MPKPVLAKPEVVLLRNSERGVFKDCRLKWWWSYVDRLVPRGQPQKALAFGTLVHAGLAGWYIPGRERGVPPWETFRREYQKFMEEYGELIMRGEDEKSVDAGDMGEFMLRHYVEHYGNEEGKFEVISPEQSCQVDVYDPETGAYLFTYVFTVDAVIRDLTKRRGPLGMLEHKTSASAEKPGTPVWLDEQGRSYWTFGEPWLVWNGYLAWNENVEFLIYNVLRKAMPDTRPQNAQGHRLNKPTKDVLVERATLLALPTKGKKVEDLVAELRAAGVDTDQLGEVSKNQPPKYFNREHIFVTDGERVTMMNRVVNEFLEMQMVKAGILHVGKNPGQHCGFCQFRDICELHESGNDWESVRDEMFIQGDPYEDHRDALQLEGVL